MLVQLTVPLPHCPWVLSGHRPFYLFIMQFLVLVLASGDEKDEGKEPEMEEFVDTKGILHPVSLGCVPWSARWAAAIGRDKRKHGGFCSGKLGLWHVVV